MTLFNPNAYQQWDREKGVCQEIIASHVNSHIIGAIILAGFTTSSTPAETYALIESQVVENILG